MDRDKMMDAMGCIDPALVEGADLPPAAKRRKKWTNPALIAACLCLMLAGTALAAELAGVSLGEFYDETITVAYPGPFGGEEERVSSSYDIQASGIRYFPLDSFSPELLDAAERGEDTYFLSREEMEAFLGFPLAENPALDDLMRGPIGVYSGGLCRRYRWPVQMFTNGGKPYEVLATFHYEAFAPEEVALEREDGSYTVYSPSASVNVVAAMLTEVSRDWAEEDGVLNTRFGFLSEEGVAYTREEYATPSGVKIPVVRFESESRLGAGLTFSSCQAYFVLDGVFYTVYAEGGDEAEAAAILHQVLDGYDAALSAEKQTVTE